MYIQTSDYSLSVFVISWEELREVSQGLKRLVGPMPLACRKAPTGKEQFGGFCSKGNNWGKFYFMIKCNPKPSPILALYLEKFDAYFKREQCDCALIRTLSVPSDRKVNSRRLK